MELLFKPIKVGGMKLKNRVVFPPIATNYGTRDGYVTDRQIKYYVERAKGGVGLVEIESTAWVYPESSTVKCELSVSENKYIRKLSELAEAVKACGAKVALQLHHAGRQTSSEITGMQPVAPSPIPCVYPGGVVGEVPRELTAEEIESRIEAGVEAAVRARNAGFDAVEVHCAHGYLIHQFLSPRSNKRTDEYGGDIKGRMRFAREIIELTREKVGKDYTILCRINGDDFVKGGVRIEDAKIHAQMLEKAGVDGISVSGCTHESDEPLADSTMASPRGKMVYLAEAIKKVVNIPVIAVSDGRQIVGDPNLAERILREGKADLIAMGRSLLADPELVHKLARREFNEIRPCIACNQGCLNRLFDQKDITCAVNATCGREEEFMITPATMSRRVLIVGGGPAGMEVARVVALRGHRVTLYERESRLGGQMLLRSIVPDQDEVSRLTQFLINQLKKLRVEIRLSEEVTADLVGNVKPEVLIIATGPKYIVPKIAGLSRSKIVTCHDVLAGKAELAKRYALLCSGVCCTARTFLGCRTAEYLASKGKIVTIVTTKDEIADTMPKGGKVTSIESILFVKKLEKLGVQMMVNTKVKAMSPDGLVIEKAGKEKILNVDKVIVTALKPKMGLLNALKTEIPIIFQIGSCAKIGNLLDAIHEGYEAALKI